MSKIIEFPKNIDIEERRASYESELLKTVNKLVKITRRQSRSEGFIIGINVANIMNIIIQLLIKI